VAGEVVAGPARARLLLVRGGELPVIRALLTGAGASVEVLLDDAPEAPVPGGLLHVGPLLVDPGAHEAWLAGRRMRCTATEFALLVVLAERPGQVFRRRQLLARLRDSADFITERTVDTHVNNLRRKLGEDGPELIETVYGIGYKMRALTRRLEAVSSAGSAGSA
jgi:DNA-binding response OmpR family regulator